MVCARPACANHIRQGQGIQQRVVSTASSDPPTYQQVYNVEDIDMYGPGGYNPVEVNDKLNQRYYIVDKLGHDGYSTIWLTRDEQLGKYVAVKVGLGDHVSNESDALLTLSENPSREFSSQLVIPILDRFKLNGPNGIRTCIVTALAKCSVAESIKTSRYMSFRPDVARVLAAQIGMAITYVHRTGFVNGDIYPGNLLLQMPASELDHVSISQVYNKYYEPEPYPVVRVDGQPLTPTSVPKKVYTPNWLGKPSDEVTLSEAKLWFFDFGTVFDPSKEPRLISFTHMQSQPPEARFEPNKPLTFPSDIWSLGLAVWEVMCSGPFMSGFLWNEDEVTADQIEALGPLPREWWHNWDARTKELTEDGQLKERREMRSLEERFNISIQGTRAGGDAAHMDEDESRAFIEMIRGMLRFRPEERLTSEQVLRSEWMREWALPVAGEVWGQMLLEDTSQ